MLEVTLQSRDRAKEGRDEQHTAIANGFTSFDLDEGVVLFEGVKKPRRFGEKSAGPHSSKERYDSKSAVVLYGNGRNAHLVVGAVLTDDSDRKLIATNRVGTNIVAAIRAMYVLDDITSFQPGLETLAFEAARHHETSSRNTHSAYTTLGTRLRSDARMESIFSREIPQLDHVFRIFHTAEIFKDHSSIPYLIKNGLLSDSTESQKWLKVLSSFRLERRRDGELPREEYAQFVQGIADTFERYQTVLGHIQTYMNQEKAQSVLQYYARFFKDLAEGFAFLKGNDSIQDTYSQMRAQPKQATANTVNNLVLKLDDALANADELALKAGESEIGISARSAKAELYRCVRAYLRNRYVLRVK